MSTSSHFHRNVLKFIQLYDLKSNHGSFETVVKDLFNLYENVTSVESTVSKGTNTLKKMLGNQTVESFSSRTCVKPILTQNEFGETGIVYESLTAQDCFQNIIFPTTILKFWQAY